MKKTLIVSVLSAIAIGTTAQNITPQMLEKFKSENTMTATDRAIHNAMAANDVRTLAVNQANQTEMDTYFTYSVPSKGITDQQSSGRCWLFTGLNVMRSKVINKHNLPGLTFSHVYNFFYDQLEKSNLFLQAIIDTGDKPMDDKTVEWLFKNPLSDGGTFTGVADLVAKYGIVPAGVMPETYASNNTSRFTSLIKRKLREDGLILRDKIAAGAKKKELETLKTEMLSEVYRILVLGFGEPVTTFKWAPKDAQGKYMWEPKEYTPRSFYAEFVGEDYQHDYIMLMNDPSRDYWKVYEIDFDRHVYDGHNWLYINLPIEEIKQMAFASIKDSTMMYFSCDVAKQLDSKRGSLDMNNYDYESLFGVTFGMDKKQRIQTFDSGSSHAMTLMAVDVAEDGTFKKWMVENSWGASSGYRGHLIMTDEWFNEYMVRLVVNKKYVPARVLDVLKQKPVRLPAWDPMFAEEE